MSGTRFAWVGPTDGFEPLLRVLDGTIFGTTAIDGWTSAASPAEAVTRADFSFVSPGAREAWSQSLSRGVSLSAPAGSCVVLVGQGTDYPHRLADGLDAAGLDTLDLTLLPNPDRIAIGGDRDTFDILAPNLREIGRTFFCGAIGAAGLARRGELRLLAASEDERPHLLPELLAEADAAAAYPQALRNVWKAGPLASPRFDAEIDRLTKRN